MIGEENVAGSNESIKKSDGGWCVTSNNERVERKAPTDGAVCAARDQ